MMGNSDRIVSDGEFHLSSADFNTIAGILLSEVGISLGENKVNLVYSRLAKRLRALRLTSFRDYCALVSGPEGERERGEMIAALTTNVTRFFREPHHFEHLKTEILPAALQFAKKGGRVRLWSAACSSGQEPYSMAMTILSLMPEAHRHDIRILATDVDPNMIAFGQAGIYQSAALESIPGALRSRWFTNLGSGDMQAGDELQSLVSFRKLNLIGNWPMSGRFHAIFCRNVVIYFNQETQSRIWERIAPLLDPNAALYIGHSERVSGPAERLLKSDGITTYRLVTRSAGPS
ncbi:MAG TPA: protein-glutamate O-methyltransferase CheR [Acidisoma sp.]|uniref:CheR family methyltransferase n=1 Tax=Acidisoma sp. TaxID=1872115 RepID=UPI002B84EBE7|nr:protein-glutamate O-methyltransferase CheR [Acidisoma sp.]HTI00236.1 protein-glutamate O-methyltransferase CheR [Acidisoma sp.]